MSSFLLGVIIWGIIFVIWYVRTYPGRKPKWFPTLDFDFTKLKPQKPGRMPKAKDAGGSQEYKSLVHEIETICAKDNFGSSDAATMVEAIKKLMDIEPATGQIWEAYGLDCLESAKITCDDCKIPVTKTIKKTGIRIRCSQCEKWLALRNSKIMIFDPSRADLEDWEK